MILISLTSCFCILHRQIMGLTSPTLLSDRWDPKEGGHTETPPTARLDTWPPTWSSPHGRWLTFRGLWEEETSSELSLCQFNLGHLECVHLKFKVASILLFDKIRGKTDTFVNLDKKAWGWDGAIQKSLIFSIKLCFVLLNLASFKPLFCFSCPESSGFFFFRPSQFMNTE